MTDRYLAVITIVIAISMPSVAILFNIEPAGAGPTDSYLDVGISNVTLTGTFGDRFIPGDIIHMKVEIGHDNDPLASDRPIVPEDDLTLVVTIDDLFDNITTIYKGIPDLPLEYTIGKNVTYAPLVIGLDLPENISKKEGYLKIDVVLTIQDNDTSDNIFSVNTIKLEHIRSQPMIWEEGQREGEYESPWPHRVNVGQVISIPFKLRNLGTEADVFKFELISFPEGWIIECSGTHTVLPGDEIGLMLPVQVSGETMKALAGTIYKVIIDVGSVIEPDRTFDLSTAHAFRFEVNGISGALLDPDPESVYLKPGASHQVVFWLRNTGNFEDVYKLDISVDQVHLDNGWKFSFEAGTRQPKVPPGERFQVTLRVTVPLDSPRYYSVILRINVTSKNTNYNTTSAPCILFTDILYGGDIESIEDPITLEPGEENIVSFNFTNTGNDKDSAQLLTATYIPSEWFVIIDNSLLLEGIGPMTTVSVEMHVYVPMTYPATSGPEFPMIVVQARGGPLSSLLDEEFFLFSIPRRNGISIECEDNVTVGSPGETVKLNISVTNMGNCNDTFSIASEDLETGTLPDLSGTVLEPGGTSEMEIMLRIPDNRCADSDPSTPWPDAEGLYDPYIMHIDGWSMNETQPGETRVSLPIMMYILPVHAIEAEIMDGPIKRLPFDHYQQRTFQVKVNNTGNVGCDVSPSLLNAPPWLSVPSLPNYLPFNGGLIVQVLMDYRALDMDNGEVKNVTIRLSIHRNLSEPLIHDLSMEFHFLPYSFHLVSLDISPMSDIIDERYVLEHGVNHTFRLLVHREGEDMLLPETMDGPYIALYIHDNGRFLKRTSIPLIEPGNETWVELGPIEIIYPGVHTLEFRIEGMEADSVQGESSMKIDVYVEPMEEEKEEDPGSAALWTAIIIVLLLIILAVLLIITSRKKETEEEGSPEE